MNKNYLLSSTLLLIVVGAGTYLYVVHYKSDRQQNAKQETRSYVKPIYEYKSLLASEAMMTKNLQSCEVPNMNMLSQRLNIFVDEMQSKGISTEKITGVIAEIPSRVLIFPEGTRIPKKCEIAGIIWYTPNANSLKFKTWRQLGLAKPFPAYDSVEFNIRFPPGFRDPTGWTDEDYKRMREATAKAEQEYLIRTNGIIPVEDLASGPSTPELAGTVSIKLQPFEIGDWNNFGIDDANIIRVGEQYYVVNYEQYVTK